MNKTTYAKHITEGKKEVKRKWKRSGMGRQANVRSGYVQYKCVQNQTRQAW